MAGQRQPVRHAGASTSRPLTVSTADADSTYGSASAVSAEAVTGSHVLTVKDYSTDKEHHAAGHRLPSETTFTVAGFSWRITYCPDGSCQGTVGWICFGHRLDSPPRCAGTDIMVQTRYSMLDQTTGQPVPSSIMKDTERVMSTMNAWSYTTFMRREKFESCFVKDNGFSVRCDVTLVRRTCRQSGVIPPPDDLGRQLWDHLASGVGADVMLDVGGEVFLAHRSVLAARSPVFKVKLFGGPDGKDVAPLSRLRIHGMEPNQFRVLLHFIYTDSLPMRW